MAKYIICDKCKSLVEYLPKVVLEGGTTYKTFICPECGYVKNTNTNHIHYGNDGKK